jgi:hypothetical protein
MRGSIQMTIIFVWIQALLGRFPIRNTAQKQELVIPQWLTDKRNDCRHRPNRCRMPGRRI